MKVFVLIAILSGLMQTAQAHQKSIDFHRAKSIFLTQATGKTIVDVEINRNFRDRNIQAQELCSMEITEGVLYMSLRGKYNETKLNNASVSVGPNKLAKIVVAVTDMYANKRVKRSVENVIDVKESLLRAEAGEISVDAKDIRGFDILTDLCIKNIGL